MKYITPEEYATRVAARCSNDFHERLLPGPVLATILHELVLNAHVADVAKKALFYGKADLETVVKYGLIASKYGWEPDDGILSLETTTKIPVEVQRTLHAIIGIITEAGELAEALIEAFAHVQEGKVKIEDAFDHINLREEYGDVLWYTQLGLSSIGSNIPECMTINDNKLERRYGATFTAEKALHRDLEAEKKELEGDA